GAGYRIPFYAYHSSFELFAGYSDVSAGTLQGLFNVSGSGAIMGARYNLHLPKIGGYEQKISFGLDYRAYQNQVVLLSGGGGLVPDITVHPVSIGYSGLLRMADAEFGISANVSQNVFPGGNDGADSDFKSSRAGAKASYRILRAGSSYTHVIAKEWQVRAVVNGQYSADALVPGEQFGFGGPDSVRGFNIREVAGDKGYATSLEIYTPELGSKFDWKDAKARLLAFYDTGVTGRNSVQAGESFGQAGGSLGVGLRSAYGKHFNLRLDFAQVIDPAGNQAKGDRMLQVSIAIPF
ncbi:MAG: ShlB/FhaC/HecB family hemolysin secretion/activation protein, partial [Sulfuricaulis sp.]|nr:ShlB/FhaC/HecB family hemolysin secretion/activation protein [Sulfuricaulis sp.]